MNSCGKIATDSSHIENAHKICIATSAERSHSVATVVSDYLGELVTVRKYDCKYCTPSQEVLNFKGINVRIMGRLVVVEHQVNDVGLGCEEQYLEGGIP